MLPAAEPPAVPSLFDRTLAISELETSWEFSRHASAREKFVEQRTPFDPMQRSSASRD